MDFIKAFQTKHEKAQSLKIRLHQHLAKSSPGRSLKTLHASDVTKPGFCARRRAIMVAADMKPSVEWGSASLTHTYAQGRAIQEWLVHQYADIGIAVGDWKCLLCGKTAVFCKRPLACPGCNYKGFEPVEVRFTSPISGISGGIDMIASIGTPKLRMVEIKTMAQDQFKTLNKPLAEHRVRTALYLRLAAESDHPLSQHVDTDTATVLYLTKGAGVDDNELKSQGINETRSPVKEFNVERDDALVHELVSEATKYTHWLRGVGGMPDRICLTETCSLASKCPVRQYCFGSVFPPGMANPSPLEAG